MKRCAKLSFALLLICVFGLIVGVVGLPAADPYPKLVTVETRLDAEKLSALERRHLKDAFGMIATMQEALEQRYQSSRLR